MVKKLVSFFLVLAFIFSATIFVLANDLEQFIPEESHIHDGCFFCNTEIDLEVLLGESARVESSEIDWSDFAVVQELDRLAAQCPVNIANIEASEAEFQEFLANEAELYSRAQRGPIFHTINVPVFQQERHYWCGPATARQVIHFLNNSAPSQSDLAVDIRTTHNGSDVHVVGSVVNNHTNARYANRHMSQVRNEWVDQARFSIDRRQPALITIRTIGVPAFPYSVEGHIVNVSGYDLAQAAPAWGGSLDWIGSIRITDPHGPGLGNRWYNVNTLFYAHVTNRSGAFVGRASW